MGMGVELSKKEKKIIRELIEKGLQREFEKGLTDTALILDEWKNKTKNNKEAYHALYNHITDFDEHIAARYDRMTGSAYLSILAGQLYDGVISEDDLSVLSGEVKEAVKLFGGH